MRIFGHRQVLNSLSIRQLSSTANSEVERLSPKANSEVERLSSTGEREVERQLSSTANSEVERSSSQKEGRYSQERSLPQVSRSSREYLPSSKAH